MNTPLAHNSIWNPSLVSWKNEKDTVVSAIVDTLHTALSIREKHSTNIAQRCETLLNTIKKYHTNTITFSECFTAIQPLAYIPWEERINIYISIINTLNPSIDSHEKIFTAISKKLSQLIRADESYEYLLIGTLD